MEEVVVALKILYGRETSIDLSKLYSLSRVVSAFSIRPIPASKAIVQPFLPADVGSPKTRFIAGKHTGSAALRHLLEQRGVVVDDEALRKLIPRVRSMAEERKDEVEAEELERLYRSVLECERASH